MSAADAFAAAVAAKEQEWLEWIRGMDKNVTTLCQTIDEHIDRLQFPFLVDSAVLTASSRNFNVEMIEKIINCHLATYAGEMVKYTAVRADSSDDKPFPTWIVDFHELKPDRTADVVFVKFQRAQLASGVTPKISLKRAQPPVSKPIPTTTTTDSSSKSTTTQQGSMFPGPNIVPLPSVKPGFRLTMFAKEGVSQPPDMSAFLSKNETPDGAFFWG
jgi:hypothetical protein